MLSKHLKSACAQLDPTIIVAVSGGRDSLVLLDALLRYNILDPQKIIVAHVSHNIRSSKAAKQDLQLVSSICKKHSLVFEHLQIDPKQWHSSANQEARARTLRYELLQTVRKKYTASKILTAHHQDDQIETICLNYLRGTGLKGLIGMQKNNYNNILRPLLNIDLKTIKAYQQKHNVQYIEDNSNTNLKYKRNQVRQFLQAHPSAEITLISKCAQTLYVNQWQKILNKDQIVKQAGSKEVQLSRSLLKNMPNKLLANLLHFLTLKTNLQRSSTISNMLKAIKAHKSGQRFISKEQNWYIGPITSLSVS